MFDPIKLNRKSDLYLIDPSTDRVIFIPEGWCDELRDDDEDGRWVYAWYGNPNINEWEQRDGNEWLTTDAQQWFKVDELATMQRIDEMEARQADPELFRLLDAINSGVAK